MRKKKPAVEKRSTLKNPSAQLVEALGGSGVTSSGQTVSERSALGLSPLFCGVRAISQSIGTLPLKVYQRVNGGKEEVREHALWSILHDAPNDESTSINFWETLLSHALLWGNGFCEIQRDQVGHVVALWPLLPDWVRVCRENGALLYYITIPGGVIDFPLPKESVLHIRGASYDGILGYRLASIARESLGAAQAVQQFRSAFFRNSATISGILSHPGTLDEVAFNHLADSFRKRHGGAANAYTPLILEDGLQFTPNQASPEASQLIETLNFSVEEVARWLGISPNKLFSMVRAQGWSTLAADNAAFVQDTLMPWAIRIQQEIQVKLFSKAERPLLFAEHDFKALLRGDSASRAQFYKDLFGIGAISINEIRASENDNPIEGGDTYFVPMNVQPLDMAINPPEPPAPAPAAPVSKDVPAQPAPTDNTDNARSISDAHQQQMQELLKSLTAARKDKERRGKLDIEEHRGYAAKRIEVIVRSYCQCINAEYTPDLTSNLVHQYLKTGAIEWKIAQ